MKHYRQWTRLEPDQRNISPISGAKVPLADPFWLLARQWWIGEFDGFDGGTPIKFEVTASHDPIAGIPTDNGDLHPLNALTTVVAGEATGRPWQPSKQDSEVSTPGNWRIAYRLGRHLQRDVEQFLARDISPANSTQQTFQAELRELWPMLLERFPLAADVPALRRKQRQSPKNRLSEERLSEDRLSAGQLLDGLALLEQLTADSIDDSLLPTERLREFLLTWAAQHSQASQKQPDTFRPEQRGHQLDLVTQGGNTLNIARAAGPTLHWSEAKLTREKKPAPQKTRQTLLPTRLRFPGEIPPRWWTFEDAELDWSAAPAGPSDLGQLLIAATFAEQGRSLWSAAFSVPWNSLVGDYEIKVIDTFGTSHSASPAHREHLAPWTRAHDSATVDTLLHSVPPILTGPDFDAVTLKADEASNVVWLIETTVTNELGRGQPYSPRAPRTAVTTPELALRLAPPPNWLAYLVDGRGGRMRTPQDGKRETKRGARPGGARLARERFNLSPIQIGPRGFGLHQHWCLARSASGHRRFWIARQGKAAIATGGSGLLHDQLIRPEA